MKQTFDLFATEWSSQEEETAAEEAAPTNGAIGLVQTQLRLVEVDDFDFGCQGLSSVSRRRPSQPR